VSIYFILVISILVNILLGWYTSRLLRKFMFISENLADLFLTLKAFQVFIKSMYGMDSYRGEPLIEELIIRAHDMNKEVGEFREIFEYSLDEEMEEELNAAEEEAQKVI
jgi:hypothetical protein